MGKFRPIDEVMLSGEDRVLLKHQVEHTIKQQSSYYNSDSGRNGGGDDGANAGAQVSISGNPMPPSNRPPSQSRPRSMVASRQQSALAHNPNDSSQVLEEEINSARVNTVLEKLIGDAKRSYNSSAGGPSSAPVGSPRVYTKDGVHYSSKITSSGAMRHAATANASSHHNTNTGSQSPPLPKTRDGSPPRSSGIIPYESEVHAGLNPVPYLLSEQGSLSFYYDPTPSEVAVGRGMQASSTPTAKVTTGHGKRDTKIVGFTTPRTIEIGAFYERKQDDKRQSSQSPPNRNKMQGSYHPDTNTADGTGHGNYTDMGYNNFMDHEPRLYKQNLAGGNAVDWNREDMDLFYNAADDDLRSLNISPSQYLYADTPELLSLSQYVATGSGIQVDFNINIESFGEFQAAALRHNDHYVHPEVGLAAIATTANAVHIASINQGGTGFLPSAARPQTTTKELHLNSGRKSSPSGPRHEIAAVAPIPIKPDSASKKGGSYSRSPRIMVPVPAPAPVHLVVPALLPDEIVLNSREEAYALEAFEKAMQSFRDRPMEEDLFDERDDSRNNKFNALQENIESPCRTVIRGVSQESGLDLGENAIIPVANIKAASALKHDHIPFNILGRMQLQKSGKQTILGNKKPSSKKPQ